MKKRFIFALCLFCCYVFFSTQLWAQKRSLHPAGNQVKLCRTSGTQILDPDNRPIRLKGANLGNWLVPEGYMFKTDQVGAPAQINQLLLELIGPDSTAAFWDRYLNNYITHDDIRFLGKIGCNHIRLPFHYQLFTGDLYLGKRNAGFEYIDRVINWCREEKLYVLLDMHCAPGGQTGYNIDDSSGYPWLFFSRSSQDQMAGIWTKIAAHYKNEPVVIGYDVVNEPFASYFNDVVKDYNHRLFLIYKRMVSAIRKLDKKHIIFLSGSNWALDFRVFETLPDNNIVYEFHKYHFTIKQEAIQQYIDFGNKNHVPVYIGETGENTDEWVKQFTKLLDENQMNWAYWPYKKMDDSRGIMNFKQPADYALISAYAKSDRSSYENMRKNMPDREKVRKALNEFLENARFKNNFPNKGYIEGLGF
ncbi:cellulase family glycosylhydrolase [Mucilaginibacter sp. cycad4]|uniref:glycoside hydrolase family 5 protein n=1 Tax=Mucilaginibacter sp. cycad4 TaxID=3342096 RepID=UPI002AAB08F8|nr:cellulase family glycosylhydrolase [Mucilaginibacter gossypii]WPV01936.1 cellulase family glycosylhydrolase [Mucilaginibacter gossypii]